MICFTGWRQGEVASLRWSAIDEARQVAFLAETKTGPSVRPLSKVALDIINRQRSRRVVGSEFVFPSSRNPMKPIADLDRLWDAVRLAAGLRGNPRPPDDKSETPKEGEKGKKRKPAFVNAVRKHDLRHTVASVLANAGASLHEIAAVLGHKDTSTAARYPHFTDRTLQLHAEQVATHFGNLTAPSAASEARPGQPDSRPRSRDDRLSATASPVLGRSSVPDARLERATPPAIPIRRMPNLILLGDLHDDPTALIAADAAYPSGIPILQVGDLCWQPHRMRDWIRVAAGLRRDMFCIFGNHDGAPVERHLNADEPVAIAPQLNFVPNGVIVHLGGLRIGCIGGATSIDRRDREPYGLWTPSEAPSEAAWERAFAFGRVDLLVTHTPPQHVIDAIADPGTLTSFGLPADWRDPVAERVEALWHHVGRPPLVAGHMHRGYRSPDGRLRVLALEQIAEMPDLV